ncbi:MAG: hypothetical protein WCI05_04600 [Myxococcales bacterium]
MVVIHGALRSRLGMLPAVLYLRRCGLDARPFGYRTRSESLETHGERLEGFLQDWLGSYQGPLGFLTHSMGGLVARAYLARPGACKRWTEVRLAMLAPPNRGSVLADRQRGWTRAIYGTALTELCPGRVARLPGLEANATAMVFAGGRGESRGYHRGIPGDNDGLVGVAETELEGAEAVFVGGLHSFLPWRPRVLALAAEFLGRS